MVSAKVLNEMHCKTGHILGLKSENRQTNIAAIKPINDVSIKEHKRFCDQLAKSANDEAALMGEAINDK